MSESEVLSFIEPRDCIRGAERFRTTWILSSLQSLEELGYLPRYLKLLPKQHETAIRYCVAGEWMPLEVANVHYATCEAMNLSAEERLMVGRKASSRAQHSALATMVKLARGTGVDMWTMQKQLGRLWHRTVDRGGTRVVRIGPKEARVEFVGCTLFSIPYFRTGMQGVLMALASLFAKSVYVHDVTPTSAARAEGWYRFQWS